MEPTRYIIHIADIHIGSSNTRDEEYRLVFDTLGRMISKIPESSIAIIAGDIFHHKTHYSGADVLLFEHLIMTLGAVCPVIIIPGNHDANLALSSGTNSSVDLITPIVTKLKPKHPVVYLRESSVYNYYGHKFHHVSVFGNVTKTPVDTKNCILLYHGMVTGAKYGNQTCADGPMTTAVMKSYKLCLLGDIHDHQFIAPTVAYPGSLIQQNLGEGTSKGFIIWDLKAKTPRGVFYKVPNASGMVRLDIRGMDPAQVAQTLATMPIPKHLIKLSVICDAATTTETLSSISKTCGRLDYVKREQYAVIDMGAVATEALRQELRALGATQEQIEAMPLTPTATQAIRKWKLISLQWSNYFKYTSGCIDFTKFQSITGVIADNMAGKSSIIDILVFSLWGKLLRGDQKSMIRRGAKDCNVQVVFECNGNKYTVTRGDSQGKHTSVTFMEGPKDLTGVSIDVTYKNIRQVIGSLDQFRLINLYNNVEYDVTRANDKATKFMEIFGMPEYNTSITQAKATIAKLNTQLRQLPVPRPCTAPGDVSTLISNREALAREIEQYSSVPPVAPMRKEAVIRAELDKITIIEVPEALFAPAATMTTSESISFKNILNGVAPERSSVVIAAILGAISPAKVVSYSDPVALRARLEALERPQVTAPLPTYEDELAQPPGLPKEYLERLSFDTTCNSCNHNKMACTVSNREELKQRAAANALANAALAKYESNRAELERQITIAECQQEAAAAVVQVQKQIVVLKAELAHAKAYENARAKTDAVEGYKKYKQYIEYTRAGAQRTSLMAELEHAMANAPKAAAYEAARDAIRRYSPQLAALDMQIGAARAQEAAYTAEEKIREKYNREHPPLNNKIIGLKLYIQALKSSQLRNNILKSGLDILVETTNQLCRQFGFNISVELGDDMHFMINNGTYSVPIAMASGMQTFAIGLAFRIAICNHLPVPKFIFVDEGFGAVGIENMDKMKELLVDYASGLDYLFCISHMPTLQNIMVNPLSIQCIDGTTTLGTTVEAPSENTCSCGKKVKKNNLKSHLATAYHKNHSKK